MGGKVRRQPRSSRSVDRTGRPKPSGGWRHASRIPFPVDENAGMGSLAQRSPKHGQLLGGRVHAGDRTASPRFYERAGAYGDSYVSVAGGSAISLADARDLECKCQCSVAPGRHGRRCARTPTNPARSCRAGLVDRLLKRRQSHTFARSDARKGNQHSRGAGRGPASNYPAAPHREAVARVGRRIARSSFWAISHMNPGFRSEHVLTARITPNESFCSEAARCVSFYRNVLDQVQAFPGTSGAALVNTLPLGGRVSKRSVDVENNEVPQGEDVPLFWLNVVTPEYFRVMGISVLSGRGFSDSDVSGAPVAVVTQETARRYWPNESAVGKHIRLLDDKDWRTVVGVIPDVRAYDLQRNVPDWISGTAYVPYNPMATLEDRRIPTEMTIAIQTASDDSQIVSMLRNSVAGLNQQAPISEVKTMGAVVS